MDCRCYKPAGEGGMEPQTKNLMELARTRLLEPQGLLRVGMIVLFSPRAPWCPTLPEPERSKSSGYLPGVGKDSDRAAGA